MARKLKYNLYAEFNRDGKLVRIETIKYKPEKISTVGVHEKEQFVNELGEVKWKPSVKVFEHIFVNDQEPDPPGNDPVVRFAEPLVMGEPQKPIGINVTVTDSDGNDTIKKIVWLQTMGEQASLTPSQDGKSAIVICPKDGDYTFSCTATDATDRIGTSLVNVKARTVVPEPEPCPAGQHRDPTSGLCVPDEVEPEPEVETFTPVVAGVGDPNSTNNSAKTFDNIDKSGAVVIALGDNEYDEDFNDFKSKFSKLKPKTKASWKGNHDHTQSESSAIAKANEEYWGWKDPAIVKAVEGNIGIVGFDTQQGATSQKSAVEAILKEFSENPAIDFIIAGCHKPIYSTRTKHSEEKAYRDVFQPLFDKYGVDFVYHGHNHNTWVTYPLIVGAVKKFTEMAPGVYDFSKTHGQIYVGNGNGGNDFYKIESNPAYIQFSNDEDFGYSLLEKSSKSPKRLRLRQLNNSGQTLFSVIIDKTGGSPEPTPDPTPDPTPEPTPEPGNVDENGIEWKRASGKITKVEQSRDQADDDRWSDNVSGLGLGYEATMIAKSSGTGGDAHFASKLFGGNHSGSGASSQRWYDLGIRKNGDVQLEWEGPHPNNHDFKLPSTKLFMTNIGVGLEGNHIGLKWCVEKVNGKQDGSPANGGVRVRMWADKDPLGEDGKPKNNWKLVCDFIDGEDIEVISPQSFSAPDTIDIEVRRSNTQTHDVYGGGQFVRAL